MTDGEESYHPVPAVDPIDDAKAPDPVLVETFQVPLEWLSALRIIAQRSEGGLDAALDVRRQVADDVGDVGRDVEPESRPSGHAL